MGTGKQRTDLACMVTDLLLKWGFRDTICACVCKERCNLSAPAACTAIAPYWCKQTSGWSEAGKPHSVGAHFSGAVGALCSPATQNRSSRTGSPSLKAVAQQWKDTRMCMTKAVCARLSTKVQFWDLTHASSIYGHVVEHIVCIKPSF